jgi:hypothetical protein
MRASLRGALLVFAPLLPVLVAAWHLMQSHNNDAELRQQLLASFGLSLLGFAGTVALLPEFTKFLSKKGLTGKDLCKKGMEGGDRPMLVFQSFKDLLTQSSCRRCITPTRLLIPATCTLLFNALQQT